MYSKEFSLIVLASTEGRVVRKRIAPSDTNTPDKIPYSIPNMIATKYVTRNAAKSVSEIKAILNALSQSY